MASPKAKGDVCSKGCRGESEARSSCIYSLVAGCLALAYLPGL
jgi:hypothetical protein